jgi:hypothetical protein
MDKDLQRIIIESVDAFFENAPLKMIEKGTRSQEFDICPHCKKEIYEKHEYSEDGGITFRHSDCKGLIDRPDQPIDDIPNWLKSSVLKVRAERDAARQKMGLNESAFRVYNDTLCPDLWDQCQHLDPRVRVNLLRIAYDFYKKTKFQAPIVDIWLMGSIANYNWTPESDADVHIILDFSQLKMPPETASKVAKAAGAMWNKEHNITVKNHKVELNIQSVKAEKPYVMGIYSLIKDQWVKHPQHLRVSINKPLIQQKFSEMKKYVEFAIQSKNREEMKKAKDFLDDYRQYGLDHGGELSIENIVYKIIRSKGLLKTLKDSITATYDQEMTVNESVTATKNDYIGGVIDGEVRAEPVAAGKVKFYMHNDFPGLISGMNSTNWRYKSEKNQVLWNTQPADEDVERVNVFLSKRGIVNPTHKNMYTYQQEVTQKDATARHPQPSSLNADKTDFSLKKLTIGNLKALRDKTGRFLVAAQKREGQPDVQSLLQKYYFYDQEIKKRLAYINKPINEANDLTYKAALDFMERRDQQRCEIAMFLKKYPGDAKVPWKTIPASLLKRVWFQFGKYQRIKENDLDKIADQLLTNIARLEVANEFQGHSDGSFNIQGEVEEFCDVTFTDEEWQKNVWRFDDGKGTDFVSDYGIEPLKKLYSLIYTAPTPEEKLYACDKALNVVHQRNDLASMFVEGGKATLNAVANQGGYDADYGYGDVNKMMRDVKEGYGWVHKKDMEKDRLHIPGERWRIKSKDAPKTPKMKEE